LGKGGKRVCIKGVEGRKKDMKRKEGFRRNDRPEERGKKSKTAGWREWVYISQEGTNREGGKEREREKR
jgi:hypothetical protein